MARKRRRPLAWLGPLVPGLILGCNPTSPCRIDNAATIPPGAIPGPRGGLVREFQDRQAAKAEYDDFVIYLHEWYKGGLELGPYGHYHLAQISKRLAAVPFPVMIEVEPGKDDVNVTRRQKIVHHLQRVGFADAESRVILGFSPAGGLYGEEAEIIFPQMIQRNANNLTGQTFGRNQLFGGQGLFGGFGGFGRFGGFGFGR